MMDKNHKILHLEIYGSYELFSYLMASGSFKLFFFFWFVMQDSEQSYYSTRKKGNETKSKEGKRLQGTIIH